MIIRVKIEDNDGAEIANLNIYEELHSYDSIDITTTKLSPKIISKINSIYISIVETLKLNKKIN